MKLRVFICLLFFSASFLNSCAQKESKINGVSFVASRDTLYQNHIEPILDLKSNHASIMPFGFIKDLEHPKIKHNTDRQWFGERVSGAKQYIEKLQKNHIIKRDGAILIIKNVRYISDTAHGVDKVSD